MTKNAIVLAGGFGTRLQSVVTDLPKPMAPVAGKPFLHYVMHYLAEQGITQVVLAVGYLKQSIINYFGNSYCGISILYSHEDTPLGTGGGIQQACNFIDGDSTFVVNGDTFFNVNLLQLFELHHTTNALLSVALRKMVNFDRYGTVQISAINQVIAFNEKKFVAEGLINGGVYHLNKKIFESHLPKIFSFEQQILEQQFNKGTIFGKEFEGYFIDIGVPEDYQKAQDDFARTAYR